MTIGKKRIYYLIAIMVFVTFSTLGISLYSLYRLSLEDMNHQLESSVKRYAKLFESVAAVDRKHFKEMNREDGSSFLYTLEQFEPVLQKYYGYEKTGEIVLATRENGSMHFLIQGHKVKEKSHKIPIEGSELAEPMRRALNGESGVGILTDYDGSTVLAAYEPIDIVYKKLGIVAKIELGELRKGIIDLGLKLSLLALALIVIGVRFFDRIATPMMARLQESESKYRTLTEHLPDQLVRYNRRLDFIYVSPNTEKLAGKKPEEYAGVNIRDLNYPKETIRLWVGSLVNVFRTKELGELDFSVEIKGVRRYFNWRIIPETDAKGVVQSVLVLVREMTRQRTSEAALLKSESKYHRLLDGMLEGFASADLEGRIIECNEAFRRMLGYDKEEMTHYKYRELTPEVWQETEMRIIEEQVLKRGYSDLYEKEYRAKDGRLVPVQLRTYLLYDDKGRAEGYWAIIWDMTEYKNQEKMMLAQSRQAAMGDMISMIAHQWRQPLATIGMAINNLQLQRELGQLTEDKVDQFSESIKEQVRYLDHTINDFRDFFKPDRAKKKTSLIKVVENVQAIIGKTLENSNIRLHVDIVSDRELHIFGKELEQVMLNLLSNAKDAINTKKRVDGDIWITAGEEAGNVRVQICDNGGGFETKSGPQLTEPYFTTKSENGTGLGLYMSKTIIEKHLRGSLSYWNEGEGACFCITFPADQA